MLTKMWFFCILTIIFKFEVQKIGNFKLPARKSNSAGRLYKSITYRLSSANIGYVSTLWESSSSALLSTASSRGRHYRDIPKLSTLLVQSFPPVPPVISRIRTVFIFLYFNFLILYFTYVKNRYIFVHLRVLITSLLIFLSFRYGHTGSKQLPYVVNLHVLVHLRSLTTSCSVRCDQLPWRRKSAHFLMNFN